MTGCVNPSHYKLAWADHQCRTKPQDKISPPIVGRSESWLNLPKTPKVWSLPWSHSIKFKQTLKLGKGHQRQNTVLVSLANFLAHNNCRGDEFVYSLVQVVLRQPQSEQSYHTEESNTHTYAYVVDMDFTFQPTNEQIYNHMDWNSNPSHHRLASTWLSRSDI